MTRNAIIVYKKNNSFPDRKKYASRYDSFKGQFWPFGTIFESMTPVGNFANSVVKSARTVRCESDTSWWSFPLFAKSILDVVVIGVEIPLENTTTIFFTAMVLIKAWLVRGRACYTCMRRAILFLFSCAVRTKIAAWASMHEKPIIFSKYLQRSENCRRENFWVILDERRIFQRRFLTRIMDRKQI